MQNNIIRDLLFKPNSEMMTMAKYIHEISLKFLPGVFIINLVVEYFRGWRFLEVVKQTFISLIAMYSFLEIHQTGVRLALEGSSHMMNKYSRNNHFVQKWSESSRTFKSNAQKSNLWEIFKYKVKTVTSDILAFGLWSLCLFFFLLLKQLYSFVYHFTYALAPLCAVLSIFPLTRNSFYGTLKSSLWCMLMPFMVAMMICIVGNGIEFKSCRDEYLVSNLEGLIQLTVSIVLILWTTVITQKIIDGTGLSAVASNLGQMASMAAILKPNRLGMETGGTMIRQGSVAMKRNLRRKLNEI